MNLFSMPKLVVGQNWCDGLDFSERIWANRQALAQTLQREIVNGIIRGDSYKTIARNVQGKFTNVSRRNIERLVFTENTFLANEAAMQVYADDPEHYQYYEYVAVMDERTCQVCAELEGQRFPISSRSSGDNFPPMHPWCRCFFDPVYEKNARNSRKSDLTSSAKNSIIKGAEEQEQLKQMITDGTVSLKLNPEVQNRHFFGTSERQEFLDRGIEKSYFLPDVTMDTLQDFLNHHAGTGKVIFSKNGKVEETLDFGREVAFDTRLNRNTSFVKVQYSKKERISSPILQKRSELYND